MSSQKSIKVIFDTNIWIGFLIGKRLHFIKELIIQKRLVVVLSEQLLLEIITVTQRPKLKRYFPENKVDDLISFLRIVGQSHEIEPVHQLCRDPKDNFLLNLADQSKADYLITGDKDLLVLNPFKNIQIITAAELENAITKGGW